jgi:hypothetical protein
MFLANRNRPITSSNSSLTQFVTTLQFRNQVIFKEHKQKSNLPILIVAIRIETRVQSHYPLIHLLTGVGNSQAIVARSNGATQGNDKLFQYQIKCMTLRKANKMSQTKTEHQVPLYSIKATTNPPSAI